MVGFCSARLQAGMRLTTRCPPEGGRYKYLPMRKHHKHFMLVLIASFLALGMDRENAMAQDRGQGRSMVISQTGIVATESPLASKAGAAILERGGNAVDAAIAAHAVMTVVAPMWNGIGGDLFAIVY